MRKEGGYIALMSVIIISLILIALSVTVNMSGFFTRFNILEAQEKLQSSALSESCVNLAMSRLTKNTTYTYTYPETVILGTDTCLINSVTGTTLQKRIESSANFLQTFTNLSVGTTVSSSQLVSSQAVVLVRVIVNNNYGGTQQASDFVVGVNASNASPSSFNGNTNGVAVYIDPGSFSASISSSVPANYVSPVGDNCSIASINAGDSSNICTITINDKPTTASLTVVANVINDNSGTKMPSDFSLLINGTNQPSGLPRTGLTPGAHTVSTTTLSGYSVSAWDSGCASGTVSLAAGDTRTCTVTYDDDPPPTPACADTVMMLDRTGSMFGTAQDPINEGNAAASLLDLYATVNPHPLVGVGSMGALYINGSTAASIPDGTHNQPTGWLTNVYGTKKASGTAGSNLTTAVGSSNQWTNAANAFFNDNVFTTDAVNGHTQSYKNFSLTVPSGATIDGIEVTVDGKTSATGTTTGNLAPIVIGSYNKWKANGSTNKVTDVVTNDGDTNSISETTLNDAQTFDFANAAIPAGATINSVTVTAYVRAESGSPTIKFRAEKGSGTSNRSDSASNITPTASYAAYTNQWTTNPFTNTAWTLAQVNSWTTSFGVVKTSSTGTVRVTQMYVVVDYTPASSLGVVMSWNNGTSWTTGTGAKTITLTNTEAATTLGSSTDKWNRTWTATEFSNANLAVRLTNNTPSGTVSVDYVAVKVYYSTPSTGLYNTIDTIVATSSSGAGSYLAAYINAGNAELNSVRHDTTQQKVLVLISDGVPSESNSTVTSAANTAKNSGTNIFTIHFGDSAGTSFLNSLSSGSGYYFNAPTSADMAGIFQSIGQLVCPALSVTPPAPPTHSNLIIITNVTNDNTGTAVPADFTINVTATNASQSTFAGLASPGKNIQIDPGSYTVTEGLVFGYTQSLGIACSGTVTAGATQTCVINNDDLPPPAPPVPQVQTPSAISIDTWEETP